MSWVYLVWIVLALAGCVVFDRQEGYGRAKLIAYRCVYILLIGIVGLSYGLGGDKFAYMGYFDYYYDNLFNISNCIQYEFVHMGFMPLWSLLMLVVKTTTDSFYVLQIVLAILVNVPIMEVVRRHTNYGFLFMLIYFLSGLFFQFNTEVMREGPALALALVAIECWINGKKGAYWLVTLICLGFHFSALVLLIFPFVPKLELTRRKILIWWGVTVLCWALSDKVLLPALSYVLTMRVSSLSSRLSIYTSVQTNIFGFLRSWASMMVLPMMALYFNREQVVDELEQKWRNKLSCLTVLFGFVGCAFAGYTRFFNYVQVFYLVMLTELLGHLLERKLHMVFRLATVVGAFIFWMWYELAYWEANEWHFYQFFVPYTCIANESDAVWEREDAYQVICDYSFYDDRKNLAQ